MKLSIEGGQALVIVKDAKTVVTTSKAEKKGQGVKAAIVGDISGATQLTVDNESAGAYFLNGGLDTTWAKDSLQFIGALKHDIVLPGLGPSPAICVWTLWVKQKKAKNPKWRLANAAVTKKGVILRHWRSQKNLLVRVLKVEVTVPQDLK